MDYFHLTEHSIFFHKYWKRKVFLKFFTKKNFRKRFFRSDFFFNEILKKSPIPCISLSELVTGKKVILENFFSRNGNISTYEMMAICSYVAEYKPKRILEIGTFDGNTTLQMALNTPDDTQIYTLDLPKGMKFTKQPVLTSDVQFICDEKKQKRKFEKSSVSHKIEQHFGDSTEFDFSKFTKKGPLDFIFIDGGHSYECVKSDTENALKILSEKGVIFWHDFTPHFGGVFRFLSELAKEISLIHIEGTNLVFFKKEEK